MAAGMDALLRGLLNMQAGKDATDKLDHPDTSETVNISALALLKMLRHARSGVPLEVMGLMLGTFVDDYTINIVDVFAMPQSGTSITVESVDPVYQTRHLEKLQRTGRQEMVVGWYHSHPGFGCWLSSVDVNTQQSFEALHPRAVAVVVDPIQSVKGKVVLEAFRSINQMAANPRGFAPTGEARQTTGNLGHLEPASLTSKVQGLNRKYYGLVVNYKLSPREQKMLACMGRKDWSEAFKPDSFSSVCRRNVDELQEMVKMTDLFTQDVEKKAEKEGEKKAAAAAAAVAGTKATTTAANKNNQKKKEEQEMQISKYGKLNAKHRLEDAAQRLMHDSIVQQLKIMTGSHALN